MVEANFSSSITTMQVYYRCSGQRGGRLELRDGRRTRRYQLFCDDRSHHLRNVAASRGHGHRINAFSDAGGRIAVSVWGRDRRGSGAARVRAARCGGGGRLRRGRGRSAPRRRSRPARRRGYFGRIVGVGGRARSRPRPRRQTVARPPCLGQAWRAGRDRASHVQQRARSARRGRAGAAERGLLGAGAPGALHVSQSPRGHRDQRRARARPATPGTSCVTPSQPKPSSTSEAAICPATNRPTATSAPRRGKSRIPAVM